jgi:hypothetical protein
MSPRTASVHEPELERQGQRMIRPALRLLAVALVVLIPCVVLAVIGHGGLLGLGIALIFIASWPLAVGLGLLFSGSVARWAARHRLFA